MCHVMPTDPKHRPCLPRRVQVQPGSFCFGDADYAKNGLLSDEVLGLESGAAAGGKRLEGHGGSTEWEQSLWVMTQVGAC